jgi:hypothetical protein
MVSEVEVGKSQKRKMLTGQWSLVAEVGKSQKSELSEVKKASISPSLVPEEEKLGFRNRN